MRVAPERRLSQQLVRVLPVLAPTVLAAAATAGAATSTLLNSRLTPAQLAGLLALLAAAAIAEAFPVPIERLETGATSLAMVFIVAGAAVYGWAPATLIGCASMGLVELARRRPPARAAYNTSIYTVAAAAAGLAANQVHGDALDARVLGPLLGASAFYAVDISLLAAVVARLRSVPLAGSIGRYLGSTFVPFLTMASLTLILVLLWEESPELALLLVGPLAAIAFYQRWIHGAMARLQEVDRMKDEFIAVASHELRTPLTAVYGAAITLENRNLTEEARTAMLSIIYRESARLARLIEEVLCVSRLESGKLETAVVPIDAGRLAGEVVTAMGAAVPEGLSVQRCWDQRLPAVAADPERVRQVLDNLVDNAIKYSPDGGRIEVRLEPDHRYLRFVVSDEGMGIPAEEHDRIFEKFHCVDPNRSGGTGLGLYICRELVRRMHGQIWVTSEPGRGSTFFVELPLAGAPPRRGSERVRTAALMPGRRDPAPARIGR